MPLITTHYYFANDVLKLSKKEISNQLQDNKDLYELFAQGFDLFQFYEFFRLKKEKLPDYFHENNTDTYFLSLIKGIKEKNLNKNSEIIAALYGHLTHYVLDSTCHPFIVYKSGIYNKNIPESRKYNGIHTKIEMQIDAYLYKQRTNKEFKYFKIHTNLITRKKFSKDLIELLNTTYKHVYNINNVGNKYELSRKLMYYSYKFLIQDPTGIKTILYKSIDLLTPNKKGIFRNYSSHITKIKQEIFNNNHKIWYHPWLENKISTDSFFDLYDKALKECIILFEKTNLFINNKITENEYKQYLKDKSYLTGLPWKQKETLKHLEF